MANKSALIRTYLAKHPDRMPKEVAEQLMGQHKGLKISPNEVSNIKSMLKKAQASAPAKPTSTANATAPTERLVRPQPKPVTSHGTTATSNGGSARATGPVTTGLAQQVATLKAVAAAIGKVDAKQILDLL